MCMCRVAFASYCIVVCHNAVSPLNDYWRNNQFFVFTLFFRSFHHSENGIKAEEQGEVKNKGTDNEIQSVRGSYSYTGPDGVLYTVTYIADENGFQPQVRANIHWMNCEQKLMHAIFYLSFSQSLSPSPHRSYGYSRVHIFQLHHQQSNKLSLNNKP